MQIFQGEGVSSGIVIGTLSIFRRQDNPVQRDSITDKKAEWNRFMQAKETALLELDTLYQTAKQEVGTENAQIFEIHKMMLEDLDYNEAIRATIETQSVNAAYAVAVTADKFAAMFTELDDSYLQARAGDVRDISNRLIQHLTDPPSHQTDTAAHILCADDFSPSETVSLDKSKVLAFITAKGSTNSHTAILARARAIPAIVGVGIEFLEAIRDGDAAILDGDTGEIIQNPDETTQKHFQKKKQAEQIKKSQQEMLRGKPNVTRDGTHIDIYANIGSLEEISDCLAADAGGIGLFRSEFLYLNRKDFPSEEEQFQIYRETLSRMARKRVVIRTLDIGADKQLSYFQQEKEENPALGMRAIRLCLANSAIFHTQLRALYRASAFGSLAILFPMVANTWELKEILQICGEVRAELQTEGIPIGESVEHGIMIETPAAALVSDHLAPMVDFFSDGTNDLTQYTLACDRQNARVAKYVDPYHPAVMRLIAYAAKQAHAHGKWIGICGELAADIKMTEEFLRMGIDELSVSPAHVLRVREAVRGIQLETSR